MNRVRRKNESYKKYRQNLKIEEIELKRFKTGRMVWASKQITKSLEKGRILFSSNKGNTYIRL